MYKYMVRHKKDETNPIARETRVGGGETNKRLLNMFWTFTVLQGSVRSLYSVQVDPSSNIGVFLSLAGKCRTTKVNKELTSSFLLNWRNPRRKLFNYWLKLTVKIACFVHACLNDTNDIRKAEKALFEVQGHIDCFLWYPGCCDGRVSTQRPDGESAVLHWSFDEIAWKCEKETTAIMEKRVDFAPGQRASPQRIVCEALFS